MTEDGLRANWSFVGGCGVSMLILFLAFVFMFSTRSVLHRSDDFSCFGQVGAGFPVSFLCDYSSGGSPLSSAGRIDSADFPYFSPPGTLVDLLFYSILLGVLFGMLWLTATGISRLGPEDRGK